MKKKRFLLLTALGVTVALLCGVGVALIHAEETPDSVAPKGTVLLTEGASVSISACTAQRAGSENSYEMPSENWCKAHLVDGNLSTGYSTDPYDRETNPDAPVTITIRLAQKATVSCVALFPAGDRFPVDYTISLSADGKSFTEKERVTGASKPQTAAVHSFAGMEAQYIRLHVTKRYTDATVGQDGLLVQLSEIGVYGKADKSVLRLVKPALELCIGETETIGIATKGANLSDMTFASSDASVAAVDGKGVVKGVKKGNAVITVTDRKSGAKAECPVYVVESDYSFDDNIMISVFWPPTPDYINDEQYRLMADAGITWVLGAGEETLATPENQLKMLELCYKYGMHMTVSDGSFGGQLTGQTAKQIAANVAKYKNIPGCNGYYMLDEPFNPNAFLSAYKALKDADPGAYMHLNFLPSAAYASNEQYKAQMNDWLRLCAAAGYPQDYLMYDRYPFGLAAGSMDRDGFFSNMKAAHDVALANGGVKTGTYIQSVQQDVAFRCPSASELRYEIYASLSFGFKQISYFTWFTPVNRSEPFSKGIISADGKPGENYAVVSKLNHEVLALGKTLINCEAVEIYLNGTAWGGMEKIPADFFVQPNDRTNYILSLLRDCKTGRNYLMIVNNDFNNQKKISLSLDSAIGQLYQVSKTDGSLSGVALTGGKLTVTLDAGDGQLYALPEGLDYLPEKSEPTPGTNLALTADVTANSSKGENGMYIAGLNDGNRTAKNGVSGWESDSREDAVITMDFGLVCTLNRIDLYPIGNMLGAGENMPRDFVITYSQDGEKWHTLVKATGFVMQNGVTPSLRFDAIRARYLCLTVTARNGDTVALAEIEVYHDQGSVPAAENIGGGIRNGVRGTENVITFKAGANLALNKKVLVSTDTPEHYRQWGWGASFLVDGKAETGWTSNVKIHDKALASEYAVIDLGDCFRIERIDVTPLGCWPENFEIRVSSDAKTWITVASETKSKENGVYTVNPDAVSGRYVMFVATKLRGTTADGYMLQLGDIAVYGTPDTDLAEAEQMCKLYTDAGGPQDAEVYRAVRTLMEKKDVTQSALDAAMKKMLDTVGKELPAKESGAAPSADYRFDYGPFSDGEEETTGEITTGEDTTVSEGETTTGASTDADSANTTAVTTAEETSSPNKKNGCGSVLSCLAVIGSVLAGVVLLRKKKAD